MYRTVQFVCFAIGALLIASSPVAYAQQEKGDKEVGISGAATITHSPVSGTLFAEVSLGRYFTDTQYFGVFVAPIISFSGDGTFGAFAFGGNYRYLFGHKNAKVWPFIGALAGGTTVRSSGGGTKASWTALGQVGPEFGLKFYASQKTSFEVSYQLEITFGSDISGGFGQRSQSLIVFGFKHIF